MTATAPPGAGRVARERTPVLGSANRLGLAVFAANVAGGSNLTTATEAPDGTWPQSLAIARAADRAGMEALLPVARWRGLAPAARREAHRTFETFTWAAAVAASTERVQVFATAHVPLQHPVQVAKMIATVDHVSGGRFGLNIVAGWNELELRMFGDAAADLAGSAATDRYAVAEQWLAFLARVWGEQEEFDEHGEWFSGEGVLSEPRPVQTPRPVVVGAGSSAAGRTFAARHCDLHVALLPSLAGAGTAVRAAKDEAASYGRELRVWAPVHVVCADTEEQARADLARQVEAVGDRDAARTALRLLVPGAMPAGEQADALAAAAITGFFALPLVGTPERVAQAMAELSAAGVDGLALSWLDYGGGLRQYTDVLLPLLCRDGLRAPGARS